MTTTTSRGLPVYYHSAFHQSNLDPPHGEEATAIIAYLSLVTQPKRGFTTLVSVLFLVLYCFEIWGICVVLEKIQHFFLVVRNTTGEKRLLT